MIYRCILFVMGLCVGVFSVFGAEEAKLRETEEFIQRSSFTAKGEIKVADAPGMEITLYQRADGGQVHQRLDIKQNNGKIITKVVSPGERGNLFDFLDQLSGFEYELNISEYEHNGIPCIK